MAFAGIYLYKWSKINRDPAYIQVNYKATRAMHRRPLGLHTA